MVNKTEGREKLIIYVDAELFNRLMNYIKAKYKKPYGAISKEIRKSLDEYLKKQGY